MHLTFSFLTRIRIRHICKIEYFIAWQASNLAMNDACPESILKMLWNLSFSFRLHWISIIVHIFNIIYVLLNFCTSGCNEMAEMAVSFSLSLPNLCMRLRFYGKSDIINFVSDLASFYIYFSSRFDKAIVYPNMKCNFVLENWF